MEITKKELEQILDQKLGEQTKELREFAEEQTDSLARIISTTVAEPMEKHFKKLNDNIDVKTEVEVLKKQMAEMRTALHLN